jgi:hypothetical protein
MDSALRDAVVEVEAHVAREGWDQPVRLFAIVPTAAVRAGNPGLSLLDEREYASLEQDTGGRAIDDLLEGIEWDADVVGAIIAVERILVDDETRQADAHLSAGRHDVRLVAGVLRDGPASFALRVRDHDSDDSVVVGPDLVPQLGEALRATLR